SSIVDYFAPRPTPDTGILSLHDALPTSAPVSAASSGSPVRGDGGGWRSGVIGKKPASARTVAAIELQFLLTGQSLNHFFAMKHRSEEHTSELQSRENLVCRLLLEKKKLQ